jgi:filamentous hemagglutinin
MEVVGRRVTVRGPFGEREIDVVVRDASGRLHGIEIKSSESAFTRFDEAVRQQLANDRWINQYGADVVGPWRTERGLDRIDSSTKILWTGVNP